MIGAELTKSEHQVNSVFLDRTVTVEIHIPEPLQPMEALNLLLLNDGQDFDLLGIRETVETLYAAARIEAVVIVAISVAGERLQEYGVSGRPDYLGRGAKAGAYSEFITKELLPYIYAFVEYPITGKRAFAGCSLGGLSAFDVAWNHPADFDLVAVFSGAFWWRQKGLTEGYQEDRDRILHNMIRESEAHAPLKFWIMTGTADETADRNGNGIIDSIDDSIDVIKELVKKGVNRNDITYYERVGGKHDVATWAASFPSFLLWAFPRKSFAP